MKSVLLKIVLPIAILGTGLVGAAIIRQQKPSTRARDTVDTALPVDVVVVEKRNVITRIRATGQAVAAREIRLAPEINGRIIRVNPDLIPGTRLAAGAFIARIDPRDYKLALVQEEGRMQQARLDYQLESTRGEIAAREWELLAGNLDSVPSASELALRRPHMEVARQQKVTVENNVEKARLNLNRTEIRAPFNSIVISKNVDIGQYVNPSTPLVQLMGTDELWVNVSIPVEQITTIDIPGVNAAENAGSPVRVIHQVGEQTAVRNGRVIRLQGQLDGQNRTARLLVSVPSPFDSDTTGLPLLAGAWVTVEIEGHPLDDVVPLPREALREGRFVWRATADNRLERVDVTVVFGDRDQVVLKDGVAQGDRVIVSPLAFPVSGMLLSPRSPGEPDVR